MKVPWVKAQWGLALLQAAVLSDAQVGGFWSPLRYRLTRKFSIVRRRRWSWRYVYGFNFCFFRLKRGKTRPKRIHLGGKQDK